LIYFDIDDSSGGLLKDRGQKMFKSKIKAIDLGEVPEGRQRFKFLIVGVEDSTVSVLSLEPDSCLDRVSTQALPAVPSAVSIIMMQDQLYLHIGLDNGVLLRTIIDNVTGGLSDSRSKFLGLDKIRLQKIVLQGESAVLALSSKPYVCYSFMNQYQMTPLSYESLETACSFSSTQCFEGIVGIKGDELRIISVERIGEVFT